MGRNRPFYYFHLCHPLSPIGACGLSHSCPNLSHGVLPCPVIVPRCPAVSHVVPSCPTPHLPPEKQTFMRLRTPAQWISTRISHVGYAQKLSPPQDLCPMEIAAGTLRRAVGRKPSIETCECSGSKCPRCRMKRAAAGTQGGRAAERACCATTVAGSENASGTLCEPSHSSVKGRYHRLRNWTGLPWSWKLNSPTRASLPNSALS